MKIYKVSGAVMAAALAVATAHSQDTRHVTEPKIPHSCIVLKAQLQADHGVFANGDTDEAKLDTTRIQDAMDKCDKGKAVELAADGGNNAFLAGQLKLRGGVILVVDKGVTLYASRDPKQFETSPDSCAKVNNEPRGCYPFITAVNAPDTGIEGDGTIDARGGAKVFGRGDMTWWQIAATSPGGKTPQQVPQLLTTDHADNFTLYRITLKNSPHFHFVPANSDGITVWGLKIDTPNHTANTDGFDPAGGTKNITLIYSYIRTGDDNFVLKAGAGGVNNVSVLHNHFYYGHGMSIGSETNGGASHLLVRDLSLDGTDNGIRIKSSPTRGGLVDGALYDDICIRNSRYPILLTASYSWPGGAAGELPVYKNIVLHNVRIVGGGKLQFDGLDATHRIGVQFDGVLLLDGLAAYKTSMVHTDVTLGPGPTNLLLTGDDSTTKGKPGKGKLDSCDAKFVPFPVSN